MTTVAIVYHSGYGHTAVLAEKIAEGVREAGGTPDLIRIEDVGQDMAPLVEQAGRADAIVFGAPTYMGGASAPMKAFIDATSKPWYARAWVDKLAGGFTNGGNYSGEKTATLLGFIILAAQHGMLWVSQSELPGDVVTHTSGSPEMVNRVGSALGPMAQSENASPEVTPPVGDRETARIYGKRIADAARRWNAGAGAPTDTVIAPELETA